MGVEGEVGGDEEHVNAHGRVASWCSGCHSARSCWYRLPDMPSQSAAQHDTA